MQNVVIYVVVLVCKGSLWQVFIRNEAQNHISRPPYTLYICIQYTYSHREGGES
jgi:hypothetical protein